MGAVIVLVLLLGASALLIAKRPGSFRVHRAAHIAAAPEQIFPHLNDFHRWAAWSPFEKIDPSMQKAFSGPAFGPGAAYEWSGNSKAGAGRMEINASTPPNRVVVNLQFTRPFANQCIAEFTLTPKDKGTEATWTMTGPVPFFGKVLHLFFDMDKMVGKDFAAGLATLKSLVETETSSV